MLHHVCLTKRHHHITQFFFTLCDCFQRSQSRRLNSFFFWLTLSLESPASWSLQDLSRAPASLLFIHINPPSCNGTKHCWLGTKHLCVNQWSLPAGFSQRTCTFSLATSSLAPCDNSRYFTKLGKLFFVHQFWPLPTSGMQSLVLMTLYISPSLLSSVCDNFKLHTILKHWSSQFVSGGNFATLEQIACRRFRLWLM